MNTPPDYAIRAAIAAANTSPCGKSKRGAAIYMQRVGARYVGTGLIVGTNGPPAPFSCTGSVLCRVHCSKICEHAEAAALRMLSKALDKLSSHEKAALRMLTPARGEFDLIHIKTIAGLPAASGRPSCVECSKAILADGRIAGVWLLHEAGWRRYEPVEFHELSAAQHGIVLSRDESSQ